MIISEEVRSPLYLHLNNYLWLIRVTLVVPKILGVGGDLWIIVLLKYECSFSGEDTQTLLAGNFF